MASKLESANVTIFATRIGEAARSTQEGVKYFEEPADGTLRRATSRRHHMIFGRRGSGKSSLLRKAADDASLRRVPIAFVDLEPFKQHSYPDLLLSVLIKTLDEFKKWIDTTAIYPASKTSFWKKMLGRAPSQSPYDKTLCSALSKRIDTQLLQLKKHLHAEESAQIEETVSAGEAIKHSAEAKLKASYGLVSGVGTYDYTNESKTSSEVRESYKRTKVDFLRRHVLEYQQIFDDLFSISNNDAFLLLDDLYHIRRGDQASVIDYFHSVGKGHHLWIKVGTIRHRSTWYSSGNPPVGVKLGDDADEINLDLTLEKYAVTKQFLINVIAKLAADTKISIFEIATSGAVDRLVLASGGVARDFLGLLRRSIDGARERVAIDAAGEAVDKITAEDVNRAAGDYDTTKRDEFNRDTHSDEHNSLNNAFEKIRKFCLDSANSNCFLVAQGARGHLVDAINELVDLKLLHKIRSRVTINTATQRGKLFEAYMMDLSQYAGARAKRGLKIIEFWKQGADNDLRKASYILEPSELSIE